MGWHSGYGVELRARRLRVRIPQGLFFLVHNFSRHCLNIAQKFKNFVFFIFETYDEDTEDDEQYRADVYDCETEVDVRTDEDTLTADTEDSCSGDATLTGDETLSAEDK